MGVREYSIIATTVFKTAGTNVVGIKGQGTLSGDLWVLLTQRASCSVAWIDEWLLSMSNSIVIPALKAIAWHKDFTTYIQVLWDLLGGILGIHLGAVVLWQGEFERNSFNGFSVSGDVLTSGAIATGGGAHENTVLIDQRYS